MYLYIASSRFLSSIAGRETALLKLFSLPCILYFLITTIILNTIQIIHLKTFKNCQIRKKSGPKYNPTLTITNRSKAERLKLQEIANVPHLQLSHRQQRLHLSHSTQIPPSRASGSIDVLTLWRIRYPRPGH